MGAKIERSKTTDPPVWLSEQRRMNALRLVYFPSGDLAHFPSDVPTRPQLAARARVSVSYLGKGGLRLNRSRCARHRSPVITARFQEVASRRTIALQSFLGRLTSDN